MEPLEQTLQKNNDWVIDRITLLVDMEDVEKLEDAFAIEREFDEWLSVDVDQHNVYSLEYIGEGSEYE